LTGGANSDGGTKPYNFYFAQISYSKSQKVYLMGDMVGRTLHHVPPLATPLAIATSSPFRYALSLHWGQLPPPNKHEKYTFLMLCGFFTGEHPPHFGKSWLCHWAGKIEWLHRRGRGCMGNRMTTRAAVGLLYRRYTAIIV